MSRNGRKIDDLAKKIDAIQRDINDIHRMVSNIDAFVVSDPIDPGYQDRVNRILNMDDNEGSMNDKWFEGYKVELI